MNKTFLILGTLPIVFLLSACDKQPVSDLTDQGRLQTVEEQKQKILDNAGTTSDQIKPTKEDCMFGCERMWKSNEGNKDRSEDEMKKDCNSLCEAGQGMQNNDISSCEKSEGVMKDACFSKIAKETNKPELCEKISGNMLLNGCYSAIAEEYKDKSVCDKIKDTMWKEVCVENAKKSE